MLHESSSSYHANSDLLNMYNNASVIVSHVLGF